VNDYVIKLIFGWSVKNMVFYYCLFNNHSDLQQLPELIKNFSPNLIFLKETRDILAARYWENYFE